MDSVLMKIFPCILFCSSVNDILGWSGVLSTVRVDRDQTDKELSDCFVRSIATQRFGDLLAVRNVVRMGRAWNVVGADVSFGAEIILVTFLRLLISGARLPSSFLV